MHIEAAYNRTLIAEFCEYIMFFSQFLTEIRTSVTKSAVQYPHRTFCIF